MKKILIYLSCMLACCLLFLHSGSAVCAGIRGFYVWRDSLLPALLPFFVCAYVMQNLGVPTKLERAALIALSLISGAPSGARLLSVRGETSSRTAAILNTVSPMFIYASFCNGMLGAPGLAAPILIAQFTAALIMLLIFPPKYGNSPQTKPVVPPLKLLGDGIAGGISAMLNICGALVFFMAFMAAIQETIPMPGGVGGAVVSGMLEMVSGCIELSKLSLHPRIMAAASAFLFSFGGLCIFAQSLTFCKLSAIEYFSAKLIQGAISAFMAWLIVPLFPAASAVYNNISGESLLSNTMSFLQTAGVSAVAMAVVLMIGAAARYRKFYSKSI